jgi:hypothetical protein
VPIGTPVETAEKRMRAKGFICKEAFSITFQDETSVRWQHRIYSNINCLECRGERVVALISDRVWMVAFAFDANRLVTNVLIQSTSKSL